MPRIDPTSILDRAWIEPRSTKNQPKNGLMRLVGIHGLLRLVGIHGLLRLVGIHGLLRLVGIHGLLRLVGINDLATGSNDLATGCHPCCDTMSMSASVL